MEVFTCLRNFYSIKSVSNSHRKFRQFIFSHLIVLLTKRESHRIPNTVFFFNFYKVFSKKNLRKRLISLFSRHWSTLQPLANLLVFIITFSNIILSAFYFKYYIFFKFKNWCSRYCSIVNQFHKFSISNIQTDILRYNKIIYKYSASKISLYSNFFYSYNSK